MAWVDTIKTKRETYFRGGYRDPAGRKLYVKDSNGRTAKFGNKKDARNAAAVKEDNATRQAAVTVSARAASMPWGEWWQRLVTMGKVKLNGRTESVARLYLLPKWQDTPLNKITHDDVQEWVTDVLARDRAPLYVKKIYTMFQASMTLAMGKGGPLVASPCTKIALPARRKQPKKYTTDEHIAAYRAAGLSPRLADAYEFEHETGLRPGELAGLHAHRVDREHGYLVVADTFVTDTWDIRAYPKDGDTRIVPLTPRAVELIDQALEGRRDLTGGCGVPHRDGETCRSVLVFRAPRGGVLSPKNLKNALHRVAHAAGIEARSPYAARRGFGTWAGRGLDIFELMAIFGHSKPEQTAEYVQQTPNARARLTAVRTGKPVALVAIDGADLGATLGANQRPTVSADVQPWRTGDRVDLR